MLFGYGRVAEQVGELAKQSQRLEGGSNMMKKPISINSRDFPLAARSFCVRGRDESVYVAVSPANEFRKLPADIRNMRDGLQLL